MTAQSAAQTTAASSATVSITAPQPVSVSITPTSASLQVNQAQQFSATVSNASNTAVNWLVSGIQGGNTTLGTISSTGLYTAPASVPNAPVTVTAQSVASPGNWATAGITVNAPVVHTVSLSWTASSGVAGYNVYRGGQSAGPFTKINSSLDTATAYTDTSVVAGQTYYYATTAVDSSGLESGYSNVVQAAIP
ncbi:MAG: Ig-like domain-containing protein [Acidobacteria bacterium]|nr:Ig-like domain-containing protein [Acidobacteriota bacterium]